MDLHEITGDNMNAFKIITATDIDELHVTPYDCIEWAEEGFRHKSECILSPKISQKPDRDSFFNTMPCCLPKLNCMGVKVVSRLPTNLPPLKSVITLFDMHTGDLKSLLEADWITSMRTGAVAALAARTFTNNFKQARFAFVGLGNIARSVFKCLSSLWQEDEIHDVWLLRYKDQAEKFIEEFKYCVNVRFHVTDKRDELVAQTDALFSCVTVMNEQFLSPEKYPQGYTCIPVHTKGFQDCDLVFDKVFGDDIEHERGFKNFLSFRSFAEIGDVLSGKVPGRTSSEERILCYNVGIALHDVWFASRIYDLLAN